MVKFEELKVGDAFRWEGKIFMKIQPIDNINSVCIRQDEIDDTWAGLGLNFSTYRVEKINNFKIEGTITKTITTEEKI